MSFISLNTKKKISVVASIMKKYSILIGEKSVTDKNFSFVPGLGMEMESKFFGEMAKDIGNGIFNILVMGTFKNGKSTIINSVVGKDLMSTRVTACTAVIATVDYGEEVEKIKVIYKEETKKSPRFLDFEKFSKEFTLTDEDQNLLNEGNGINRFAEIAHVEMHSKEKLFASGLRIIDSPGLEEDISRTATTNEYIPKANAIIFVMNANRLFSATEKEYICENFVGKHKRNVFFMINRFDNINGSQAQQIVKSSVRENLREVFTDDNNNFDEVLYSQRVFFTNAYGAFCVRTGTPYKISVGSQEIEVPIKIEDTGISEFESSLQQFLNSDDRIRSIISSIRANMQITYRQAVKKVASEKAARALSSDERQKRADFAQEQINKAKKNIEKINNSFKHTFESVSKKIYDNLIYYVNNEMPKNFQNYTSKESVRKRFEIGNFIQYATSLALFKIPFVKNFVGDPEEKLKPFVEQMKIFIELELNRWVNSVDDIINEDLLRCQEKIDEQIHNFDLLMNSAKLVFNDKKNVDARISLKEIIEKLSWEDIRTHPHPSFNFEITPFERLKHLMLSNVESSLIVSFIPIITSFFKPTFILMIIYNAIEKPLEKNSLGWKAQELINIGNTVFKELEEKIKSGEFLIKQNLQERSISEGKKIIGVAEKMVDEAEKNLRSLLSENVNDCAFVKSENARADKNLTAMEKLIDDIVTLPFETDFKILFMGDLRSGKTTLINAISKEFSYVQLIEVPIQEFKSIDNVSKEFIQCADAIVFSINALRSLNANEKNIITYMCNVESKIFFVVTHIDLLKFKDWQKIQEYMSRDISSLLNNSKYKLKIFFVNAYAAFKIRTNHYLGIPLEGTGILDLDKALSELFSEII